MFLHWLDSDFLLPAHPDTISSASSDANIKLSPGIQKVVFNKATVEDILDEEDVPSANTIDPDADLKAFPTWGIFPVVFRELSEAASTAAAKEVPVSVAADDPGAEQPEAELDEENLFTRTIDPFKPARFQRLLELIEIGDDLTTSKRQETIALIVESADIFAVSVAEVTPLKGAILRLQIPEGAIFSKKVHQCSLKAPERDYYYPRLDELE